MKTTIKKEIKIQLEHIKLEGILTIPPASESIIIFSHGSGSSRFSPRNNYVASFLNGQNMATLLVDLLTVEEDKIYDNRFNIDLLTERLIEVSSYIACLPELKNYKIGYFGASTGAASALKAAGILKKKISAVVSRGGRPDLAGQQLKDVASPVLLIVGSYDTPVVAMNREALKELTCEKKMEIVDKATHLFEEEGKLEEVAMLASAWFKKYLSPKSTTTNAFNTPVI